MENNTFNLEFLLDIVRRYLKYIGGIVLVSAILAIIFTMPTFYAPEYKSSTVIFPTNPQRFDATNLFAVEPTVYLYGDSKSTEQLKSIANSEELMLMVLDELNLWPEYGVDKENDASPKFQAARVYGSRVSIVKTGGNGLAITAYDTDPQRAADMVNLIVSKTDEFNKRLLNKSKASILEIYKNSRRRVVAQIDLFSDSTASLRKRFGVLHDQGQTEVLVDHILSAQTALAEAKVSGSGARIRLAQRKLDALSKRSGGMSINLENYEQGYDKVAAMDEVTKRYAHELKYIQSKIDFLEAMKEADFSTIIIIEKATASDRKAKPIRWLILLTVMMLAALISLIAAVLIDLLIKKKSGK